MQNLVNAYNGIDSRIPEVPYTGVLTVKQGKDSLSPWGGKSSTDPTAQTTAVSNLKNPLTNNSKMI